MEVFFGGQGIGWILVLIWNFVLTGLFLRQLRHYRGLLKGTQKGNLEKILEKNLKQVETNKLEIDKLSNLLLGVDRAGKCHFQKAGLVKFNPFSEMGGNQSFSLALLDGNNSGLVVTSLHGRDLTRLYVKLVKEAKVVGGKLSKEEKSAINQCFRKRGKQ